MVAALTSSYEARSWQRPWNSIYIGLHVVQGTQAQQLFLSKGAVPLECPEPVLDNWLQAGAYPASAGNSSTTCTCRGRAGQQLLRRSWWQKRPMKLPRQLPRSRSQGTEAAGTLRHRISLRAITRIQPADYRGGYGALGHTAPE